MTDHYHDQVRHQLDQTRQALKAAEDELAANRQRAARHTAVETVLREVLATFVHKVHPGRPCLQSQMVNVETVEQWRQTLAGTTAEIPQSRSSAGALMAQVQQLGGQLKEAEARIAAVRAYAQQLAADGPAWDGNEQAAGEEILRLLDGPADSGPRCCVCGTTEHGGRAFYENYLGQLFCWPCADGDPLCTCCTPAIRRSEHAPAAEPSPVVDTCHTVTVDGDTIRVRGAGTLGPVGEAALAEVIRLAKRKLEADKPPRAHECHIREDEDGWHVSCTNRDCDGREDVGSEHDAEEWTERHQAEAAAEDAAR